MTLTDLEQASNLALKQRDEVRSRTLRLLLARAKNERIALGRDLTEQELEAIVQSEHKRRMEAAAGFEAGARTDMAAAERAEAEVLLQFLPPQATEADIANAATELVASHGFTAADFGAAMKLLKERFGATASGALLAKILKEKLT